MSISISCPKHFQNACSYPNCMCFGRSMPPSPPTWTVNAQPHGCICPPGSEATCKGLNCPRRSYAEARAT
jgi:hypothetical protein